MATTGQVTVKLNLAAIEESAALATTETRDIVSKLQKIEIANHSEYAAFADALFEVKEASKKKGDERDEWTRPLLEYVAKVNERYAPALKFLAEAEKQVKDALRDYNIACEKARSKDLQQSVKLSKVDPQKARQLVLRAEDKIAPKIAGISFQGRLDVEVVDAAALPADFLRAVPDVDKIRLAVERGEIVPGVLVTDNRIVKVTTSRRVKEEA